MSKVTNWQSIRSKYKKLPHYETPLETTPYGSREAVITFSRKFEVVRFTDVESHSMEDGYPRLNEGETGFMWLTVLHSSTITTTTSHGDRDEGGLIVFYVPDHPNHDGDLFLQSANDDDGEYSGFSDLVKFDNEYYAVLNHWRYDVGVGDQDRFICKARLVKYFHQNAFDGYDDTEALGHYE